MKLAEATTSHRVDQRWWGRACTAFVRGSARGCGWRGGVVGAVGMNAGSRVQGPSIHCWEPMGHLLCQVCGPHPVAGLPPPADGSCVVTEIAFLGHSKSGVSPS